MQENNGIFFKIPKIEINNNTICNIKKERNKQKSRYKINNESI